MFVSGKQQTTTELGVKYTELGSKDYTVEIDDKVLCRDDGYLIVFGDKKQAQEEANYFKARVVQH